MRRKLIVILLIVAALLLAAIVALLILQQQPASAPATKLTQAPATESPAATPIVLATQPPAPPKAADDAAEPESVVRIFFDNWNRQNTDGMEALRVASARGLHSYDELQMEAGVELLRAERLTGEEADARLLGAALPENAQSALVATDYILRYSEAGQAEYLIDSVQRSDYLFWLVRESTDGPWRIALEGY